MFCKYCGKEVEDRAVFCSNCGRQLAPTVENPSFGQSAPSNQLCSLAVVGFVLSFFIALAGLICSAIAYGKCRDEKLSGEGFAVAGVAISIVSMVLAAIVIVVTISMEAHVMW